MNPFRPIALAAAALSVVALSPLAAQAQDFPTKSITFVVPFAAGTATDQDGTLHAAGGRYREAFEEHKRAPHFAAWRQVADRVLTSQVNTRGTLVATNAHGTTA